MKITAKVSMEIDARELQPYLDDQLRGDLALSQAIEDFMKDLLPSGFTLEWAEETVKEGQT